MAVEPWPNPKLSIPEMWHFDWSDVWDNPCYICGSTGWMTREHFIPKSKGGCGGSNVLPACSQCNRDKADHLPSIQLFTMLRCSTVLRAHLYKVDSRRYVINSSGILVYWSTRLDKAIITVNHAHGLHTLLRALPYFDYGAFCDVKIALPHKEGVGYLC